jgi:anaerobic selenocysteine-containing dehydrogenase
MHNLPTLAKGPFRCTALDHPDDAERLGLREGELATLKTAQASLQAQVHISPEMMPGVVSLPHGWGHDLPGAQLSVASQRPGVNLNALLDDSLRDPLSGNAVLGGVAVQMRPHTAS